MLRFQWNALRVGDDVLVHDDLREDLAIEPAVVLFVDARPGGATSVGVRSASDGRVVRPRRHAVHLVPLDATVPCWRCDAITARERSLVAPMASA
jgi:hypothetical protein